MLAHFVAIALVAHSPSESSEAAACAALDGAKVISPDGTYLGKVASPYDSDSIFNNIGT